MICHVNDMEIAPSHPSRGGWIEIVADNGTWNLTIVPPLTGWVD